MERNNRLFYKVEMFKYRREGGVRGFRVGHGSGKISTQCVMSTKEKRSNYLQNPQWKSRALCWIERESDAFIKPESFNQIKCHWFTLACVSWCNLVQLNILLFEKKSWPENRA